MSHTIGQFDFTLYSTKSGDDFVAPPVVHLSLHHWGSTAPHGAPLVSPQLMTEREIDQRVADLKADLDAVGDAQSAPCAAPMLKHSR